MKISDLVGKTVVYKHDYKTVTHVRVIVSKNTRSVHVKLKGVGYFVRIWDISFPGQKIYINLEI